MIRVVLKLLFIMSMLSLGLMGCAQNKNEDCGYVTNVYGQRITWKNKEPIPLYIDASVPASLKPSIYRAVATWERNAGRQIFQLLEENSAFQTKSQGPGRDRKNAIYFLNEWESDRKSEQGRTSVYWAGDEIQEADIRLNAADFNYYDQNPQILVRSTKNQTSAEGYNFEALILHELGHFLGLKHREHSGTVMATHLSAYNDRVNLAQVDQVSVQCEY